MVANLQPYQSQGCRHLIVSSSKSWLSEHSQRLTKRIAMALKQQAMKIPALMYMAKRNLFRRCSLSLQCQRSSRGSSLKPFMAATDEVRTENTAVATTML
mmetsp:Transcript_8350/g.14829  ORF Transcript_8350/g.14829 Transcript_8350/m.14829 type:complete len:100 (-) Transcript_8350:950-1249(-)